MGESKIVDGRLERGIRAREQLLLAALPAFAAEGFAGVSIANLALDLGIAKATVLHHFPRKEALYGAVLEAVAASLVPVLSPMIDRQHADAELVAEIAAAYFHWAREHADAANLLTRELLDNSERAARAERWHLRPFTDRVGELIRRGQALGLLRDFEPALAIEMMLGYAQFHVAATPTRAGLMGKAKARAYERQAAQQWAQAMARAFAI